MRNAPIMNIHISGNPEYQYNVISIPASAIHYCDPSIGEIHSFFTHHHHHVSTALDLGPHNNW